MSSEKPASYGANRLDPPVIGVAASSAAVLFEWVALVPLTIYLAQAGLSHWLVGRTALAGRVVVSLFPRLGVLNGIATLLCEGPDYLDRAASVSELRRTVWHVDWGSIFPCANGAASVILTRHAIRAAIKIPIRTDVKELLPEYVAKYNEESKDERGTVPGVGTVNSNNNAKPRAMRRPQTLYILDCTMKGTRERDYIPKRDPFSQRHLRVASEVAVSLTLVSFCILMILMGLYGSATACLISIIFHALRLTIQVTRPEGYLESNEPNQDQACMLAAIHENASTWYLYVGSRSVVDWLLNKSIISGVNALGGYTTLTALLLYILAALQLATMTYAAAQKGWDGIGLLVLVLSAWLLDHVLCSDDRLAEHWLRAEGVEMQAYTCEFSGRVPMIGAVQALKESRVTSWMDQILAPAARREVWLEKLQQSYASLSGLPATGRKLVWGPQDGKAATKVEKDNRRWVEMNFALVRAAVDDINKHMTTGTVIEQHRYSAKNLVSQGRSPA